MCKETWQMVAGDALHTVLASSLPVAPTLRFYISDDFEQLIVKQKGKRKKSTLGIPDCSRSTVGDLICCSCQLRHITSCIGVARGFSDDIPLERFESQSNKRVSD